MEKKYGESLVEMHPGERNRAMLALYVASGAVLETPGLLGVFPSATGGYLYANNRKTGNRLAL